MIGVNLTPREQADAVALAPNEWKACWNAGHIVSVEGFRGPWFIEFLCRDCKTGWRAMPAWWREKT